MEMIFLGFELPEQQAFPFVLGQIFLFGRANIGVRAKSEEEDGGGGKGNICGRTPRAEDFPLLLPD